MDKMKQTRRQCAMCGKTKQTTSTAGLFVCRACRKEQREAGTPVPSGGEALADFILVRKMTDQPEATQVTEKPAKKKPSRKSSKPVNGHTGEGCIHPTGKKPAKKPMNGRNPVRTEPGCKCFTDAKGRNTYGCPIHGKNGTQVPPIEDRTRAGTKRVGPGQGRTRDARGQFVDEGDEAKRKTAQRIREEGLGRKRDATSKIRDIAPLNTDTINWERRLATRESLKLFCETYLPTVFYLGWSDDQLKCVDKLERVFRDGGMFTLAMPRGGGKTAICRAAMLWGTANAFRRFPFFVGATQPKAIQTLDFVKTYWYRNKSLREDFPEIGHSVDKIENRYNLAKGQTYNGEPTFIEWGSEAVQYPCLLLPEEHAAPYLDNIEDFMIYMEDYDAFITKSAGITIRTSGIDGSIRGEAEVHPVTLEQPRPDVVLLDDVQKDIKADSPAACEKMERLIDGAIQGLAGPGKRIAAVMPCTVIRDGDVADTFLDRLKKPEWKGERCSLVTHWPDGITNHEITLETEAGKLWNEYGELRNQSFRLFEDARLANDHYEKNRKAMDEGFVVSWPERYDPDKELSAQQHAMNLRMSSPQTFGPEFQNIGRRDDAGVPMLITADQLAKKTVGTHRGSLPMDTKNLVGFIDVQDEMLFWGVFACAPDYTGVVVDYGTFPEVRSGYFTKNQTQGWSMLTRLFFKHYPEHKDTAVRTESGKVRAPLEAKIYHALSQLIPQLLEREFIKEDGHQTVMKLQRLGVDTRWGQVSDVIKRYVRECGYTQVVPCFGQHMPPTHRQFEEYERKGQYRSWIFEDSINPLVKEVKWVYKPDLVGQFGLTHDASRMKDFLMARLGSPPGSRGSVSLFEAPPDQHEMFAKQVCDSEYPEPVAARGIEKNQWMERDGRPDNEYLDICVGCLALAGLCGSYLPTQGEATIPKKTSKRKRLSDHAAEKRRDANRHW